MSLESAKEFIERMKTDEGFARQVASKKDKEERMKFVSEQGFIFSEQEIVQITQEISDDELQNVVGGWWGCFADGWIDQDGNKRYD